MRRLAAQYPTLQVTKAVTSCVILALSWQLPNTALTLVNVILSLALLILFIASAYRLRLLPITDSYNSTTRW